MVFLQDVEVYINLLNVLVLEYKSFLKLVVKNLFERVKNVFEYVDRMGCRRYLIVKDIVEGFLNFNFVFVVYIFQYR